jgi:hypothetical protein
MFLKKVRRTSVETAINNGTLCPARTICLIFTNFKVFYGWDFEFWSCSLSWFDNYVSVEHAVSIFKVNVLTPS